MIKLKIKHTATFEQGMVNGVIDLALSAKKDASRAALGSGFYSNVDIHIFQRGYELGHQGKYIQPWCEGKKLLFVAVANKDIQPVGWKISYSPNGYYVDDVN